MGIAGQIGFLMVQPVSGGPVDRSALQRQGAAQGEEILQRQWNCVRPVRVQAMIPHADPNARCNPVQQNRNRKIPPVEHEQRGDRCDVKKTEGNGRGPVEMLSIVNASLLDVHYFSAELRWLRDSQISDCTSGYRNTWPSDKKVTKLLRAGRNH